MTSKCLLKMAVNPDEKDVKALKTRVKKAAKVPEEKEEEEEIK
jgi:hypothetical protein